MTIEGRIFKRFLCVFYVWNTCFSLVLSVQSDGLALRTLASLPMQKKVRLDESIVGLGNNDGCVT